MTPFGQVFRLWLRRASWQERGSVAASLVLLTALITWFVVPVGDDAADVVQVGAVAGPSGGAATGAGGGAGPVGTGGVTLPEVGGSAAAPTAAAPGPATAGAAPVADGGSGGVGAGTAPSCPAGTDRGVSATELHVAATVIDFVGGAGNSAFDLPPPDEQESLYEVVVDSINQNGGICGRQVVVSFHRINPIDSSASRQACLDIAAEQPFFAFDNGGATTAAACFAQNETPVWMVGPSVLARQYYPYVYTLVPDDLVYRNAILDWAESGAFDAGGSLGTIGVLFHNCYPEATEALFAALREAGIPDDRVSRFDLGPCNGFAPPNVHQQAILQFRGDRVTHVLTGFVASDFGNFTRIAGTQGFRPQYRIPDVGAIATSYGALAPDWANIDGAMGMVNGGYGEERTPGYAPSAATTACNEIMTAAGKPPVYQQGVGLGGVVCNQLWLLKAMTERAPAISRTALAEGLNAVGSFAFSYPYGPGDFSAPGTTYGGQFVRSITASSACSCWQLAEPDFRPGRP